MTRLAAALLLAAACGGSSKQPAPEAPAKVSAKPVTRVPVEDSEPDDGVAVIGGHGHMDPAAVEAGVAPHTGELGECYTAKVGRRRWLGGHVSLHWDIKADGTVTKVVLAESDLGAWPIEKCLVETAKLASFTKPIGGDADFSLPLEFSAKGKPSVWDEDQALKAIGGQLVKLDACGKKTPVPDDVTVTLYVGPHGAPLSAGFSSPKSVLDPVWAECAEKAVMAWRLPDPKGQVAKLAIRYRAQ